MLKYSTKEGGEKMDKKDLEAISQIVNSAMEGVKRDLRNEIFDRMNAFEEKMSEKINVFEEKMTDRTNAFEEKMLDRMFLFEQDYGKKIDAIFDVAVMQKDKAQEMYKNQEKFGIQVDNLDTKVFDLDQRVFKLEHC